MKFAKYSPDTIAELLIHLAEHETFPSLKGTKNFSDADVKEIFNDMAGQLMEESKDIPIMRKSQVKQQDLPYKTHKVISKLSPQEEEILFKTFKIS